MKPTLVEDRDARPRDTRRKDKEIVIGIRQRNGELRLFHSKDVKAKTLAKYIRENVSEDAEVIFTDDYPLLSFRD